MQCEIKKTYAQSYVDYIFKLKGNKAACASLRRGDNPNLEHKCWEYIAGFDVKILEGDERFSFLTIASSIAKSDNSGNGTAGIGRAIASCYQEGSRSDQAKAKMRRLFSCSSLVELCGILRPLLSLIQTKGTAQLNYSRLLNDLRYFERDNENIKLRWAKDFYANHMDKEVNK